MQPFIRTTVTEEGHNQPCRARCSVRGLSMMKQRRSQREVPSLRVGRALFAVLAVLNTQNRPVTAAFVRAETGLPRSNVSAALSALATAKGVLIVAHHPTETYDSIDGPKPRLQYQLTDVGRSWFAEVVRERACKPERAYTLIPLPVAPS